MAAMPLEAGSVVGRRYRLERELTRQGGMGVVWTAIHLVTKRRVAIKLLRGGGQGDAASRARLLREARASCAVEHPNVLPVLDVIDADGAPALVMELLEGESLRETLERKGALGIRETCRLLAPVARALGAAHAARIVHRDVKPENVFLVGAVGSEATVKVLDFGIAKIVATEEAATNLTETGAMLGTPYYMAPEQAFGERDVGPAADAWALGIVVYECLTGARPTQAENLGQVIKRITQDRIVPVEELVRGVPAPLAALVAHLLERDVAAREVDMTRVASTLAACAGQASDDVGAKSTSLHAARRTPLLVLAAVGAAAVALAAGWRTLSSPQPDAPSPSATAAAAATPAPTATATAITTPIATPTPADPPSASARPLAPSPPPRTSPSAAAPSSATPAATSHPQADAGATGPGHVIIDPPF